MTFLTARERAAAVIVATWPSPGEIGHVQTLVVRGEHMFNTAPPARLKGDRLVLVRVKDQAEAEDLRRRFGAH